MTYRKQRKRVPVSHVDDWLMTYADIITLLLCFFAIIIITSIPKKNVVPKIIPTPVVEQKQVTSHPLLESVRQIPEPKPIESKIIESKIAESKTLDIFPGDLPFRDINQVDHSEDNIVESLPTLTNDTPATTAVAAASSQAPTDIIAPPPSSPAVLEDKSKPSTPINFDPKGNRITTLEISSATFFDSGSATLVKSGADILHDVALRLKSDAFKDYQITVEGHTDDTPIRTVQFLSNWELSTARASAVVQYFLEQGIPAHRLRAAGYADTFPKMPNRDALGNPVAENRALNRRVVIKLEKIESN